MPEFLRRYLLIFTIVLTFIPVTAAMAADQIGVVDANGIVHVTPGDAARLMAVRPEIIVLDVRTPAEFKAGHIKGAVNIDFYARDFDQMIAKLDRNTAYLVHCRTGQRSGATLPLMLSAGIKDITHMDFGFSQWYRLGLPVSTD